MLSDIKNPEAYRTALYVRLSKEDENEGPSESITNQLALLADFAQSRHLEVYDRYIDDGWSGTDFDRPAFRRMTADIEAKRVNMVITKDLSRLGRDYIMTGFYMEKYFPEKRVRYISLLDGIDTGVESSANDITPFRAIMNDMYAKDISKKIKAVKRRKQKKGQFIGGKPVYGYKMHPTEKNRIVIDGEAAGVVRRIFGMALDGMSCRAIAEELNACAVPSPALYAGLPVTGRGLFSGLWSSERISEMLQNETYIGNMVQGRSVKVSYKSKKCVKQPRKDWVVVENTHEPLVSADVFQKVQALLDARRHMRTRTYDFLLKGLIFCHECSYPLAVINRRDRKGNDTLYFVCRTYQRFSKSGACTCHSIKEKTVTDAVTEKIWEICGAFLDREKLLPTVKEYSAKSRKNENGDTAEELERKIDALTANLDRVYLDSLGGLLDKADFERIFSRIKLQRRELEEKLRVAGSAQEKKAAEDVTAGMLAERFLSEALSCRAVLTELVERIELTEKKEIIIKFRFRNPKEDSVSALLAISAAECIAH